MSATQGLCMPQPCWRQGTEASRQGKQESAVQLAKRTSHYLVAIPLGPACRRRLLRPPPATPGVAPLPACKADRQGDD
jgi:hypothetical protein